MVHRALFSGLVLPLLVLAAAEARAQGASVPVPIGAPEVQEGLRISAAYLPRAAVLDPPSPSGDPAGGIHLQLDVDALRGNPYGFEAEDSVPYLRIPFVLVHETSGRRVEGVLAPMVSNVGFHYGANLALAGPGAYTLTVELRPPEGLARHADRPTGGRPWWTPFLLTWKFRYPPD